MKSAFQSDFFLPLEKYVELGLIMQNICGWRNLAWVSSCAKLLNLLNQLVQMNKLGCSWISNWQVGMCNLVLWKFGQCHVSRVFLTPVPINNMHRSVNFYYECETHITSNNIDRFWLQKPVDTIHCQTCYHWFTIGLPYYIHHLHSIVASAYLLLTYHVLL